MFLLARRIIQNDRSDYKTCDVVARRWRRRVASQGFHTANAQQATMKYLEGGHLEEVPDQDNERLIVCSSSSVQTARTRSIINLVGMVLPPANEQYRDWSIGLACLKPQAPIYRRRRALRRGRPGGKEDKWPYRAASCATSKGFAFG